MYRRTHSQDPNWTDYQILCVRPIHLPAVGLTPLWGRGFKDRKNWGNFSNYDSSLMMRFPNPEGSLLLRMMSQLDLECKPDNKTFLLDWGENSNIFLTTSKTLVLATWLGLSVCQGLPAWLDNANPGGHRPYFLLEASFGNKAKACGRNTDERVTNLLMEMPSPDMSAAAKKWPSDWGFSWLLSNDIPPSEYF